VVASGDSTAIAGHVRKLRGHGAPDAHPVIITAPGEEGQVDYGEGPMVRHPGTGKYRRARPLIRRRVSPRFRRATRPATIPGGSKRPGRPRGGAKAALGALGGGLE
jgi:hypothetical protein